MPKKTKQGTVTSTLIKSSNNALITEDKAMSELGAKYIQPPFNFDTLIKVYEMNFIAHKAVDIFAKKVAYTGYEIVRDGEEEEGDTLEEKIKKATKFLENINPDITFDDLMYFAAVDYKITGNYAQEVVPNAISGQTEQVFHIPITTARVAKGVKGEFRTGQRFAQIFDTKYEEVIMYNKYYPNIEDRKEENGFNAELNNIEGIPTHSMIWGKNANPGNPFYGYSSSGTVARSYLIKKYIDDSHIKEFENSFMNKFAIIVEEGILTKESINSVQDYLASVKESGDWVAIPVLHNPTGKIRIEKLGDSVSQSGYLDLLEKVNQEVIVAFGVPPILLGITDDSPLANQEAQEKKFYYEEVIPFQNMYLKPWNRMLKEELGLSGLKLVPKIPDFKDLAKEIEIAVKGIEKGIFSINRAKALMGEKPLLNDEGEELEGASESYIYIGGKPVPVKELTEFTAEAALNINVESLIAQAGEAGEKLQKGIMVQKEAEKLKIKYDEVD